MYRVLLHYQSILGKLAATVPRTNGTLLGTCQRLTKSTLADASLLQGESEQKSYVSPSWNFVIASASFSNELGEVFLDAMDVH